MEPPNPGGGGALIETRSAGKVVRRDVYISSPDTTNNRMALNGAIATFALLSRKRNRFRLLYVSDSEYLVKGMSEWIEAWVAKGWRRKGGEIQNVLLWQKLLEATAGHDPVWRWVRGHAGHAKNEYANYLAMWAATEQVHSEGAVPSGFDRWLAKRRGYGKFTDFDPDADFANLESELSGET